jgi:hypothetical protein
MPDRISQQELAYAIGYSQGRVSEVTGEDDQLYPDFMDVPFDPDECAVYKGGHFQGYDPSKLPEPVWEQWNGESSAKAETENQFSTVPEENALSSETSPLTERSTSDAAPDQTPQIQHAAQVFLPRAAVGRSYRSAYMLMRHSVGASPSRFTSSELLSRNDVHLQREETKVSVLPEESDVSRSVAYGSAGYVAETAVKQDPALAWAALGLAGGGVGAFAGYQAEDTAKGMAVGAAAGATLTLVSGLIGVAATGRGPR